MKDTALLVPFTMPPLTLSTLLPSFLPLSGTVLGVLFPECLSGVIRNTVTPAASVTSGKAGLQVQEAVSSSCVFPGPGTVGHLAVPQNQSGHER